MLKELCDVMEKGYSRGFITTRDGNASFHRNGSKLIHITPSGERKNVLRVEDIVKITMTESGIDFDKSKKPSGEIWMHYFIHRDADQTLSIVHMHPTHVVAAMHAGWDLVSLAREFPELGRYTSVGSTVPVIPVTTELLGKETHFRLFGLDGNKPTNGKKFHDIVGQKGHGVCAVARDPWSAWEHIERLDHICEIVLKSGVKPG